MKPADIPSDDTLRDLLFGKVKNSNLMSHDIHMYNSLNEGDPKKSYQTVRDMIRRHIERQTEDKMLHIERQTEDKMLLEKEKAVKNVANIFQDLKPGGPAPKAKATPAPNEPKKPRNPSHREQWERLRKRRLSNQPPNPKRHPEDKKGKGHGDGKDRGRSTSVDKKKIPRKFLKVPCWNWIRGNRPKGKECKFHHDPKAAPKKGTSLLQIQVKTSPN